MCVFVQKEIVQMQAEVQRRIQETEKDLNVLPHAARQHKVGGGWLVQF